MGRETTVTVSLAVAGLVAPPPDTVAVLVNVLGVLLSTLTTNEIGGYEAPGASAFDRVHDPAGTLQTQFKPAEVRRQTRRHTIPEVAAFPALVTVMVKTNCCPRVALPLWVLVICQAGWARTGCVASRITTTLTGMPTPRAAHDVLIALRTQSGAARAPMRSNAPAKPRQQAPVVALRPDASEAA